MEDLVKLETGGYGLVQDAINTIVEIENKIKELKKMQDGYKATLLREMEEKSVLKIDVPELILTRIEATQRETFDSKKLREENPDLYDQYVKFTDVKSSLRITLKEKTEDEKKLEEIKKILNQEK